MTCRILSKTRPSHIVRNISTASEYGIAYSNSVRIGPRLRLFSVIVALESAIRTLALFPLLLAISPSRIWIRRVTELFQSSFASKNLRSISIGMSFSAEPTGTVLGRKTQASGLTFGGQRELPVERGTASGSRSRAQERDSPQPPVRPLVRTPTDQHGHRRAKLGDGNVVVGTTTY